MQQQVFALDAKYNAHRAVCSPNFRTLYIRRRSQLLRETERNSEKWKQYLKLRSLLLLQRYGSAGVESSCSSLSRTVSRTSISTENQSYIPSLALPSGYVVPTNQAEASRAMVGDTSISENYAFVGVHHIFDQHCAAVTMVKFANNDQSTLCCSSIDCTLSICDVACEPPKIAAILKGHSKAVTGFDWSVNNDLIVSSSLDGTCRLWKVGDEHYCCLRVVQDPLNAHFLCCLFQPINNNIFVTGNNKGELRTANVSTGRFMKNSCRIGGNIISITCDNNGQFFWVGNDHGDIVSVFYHLNGGLCKTRKMNLGSKCSITNLSYRAWISREARDPLLLVNVTNNSLYLFSIIDCEGSLQLKRKFQNRHQKHIVRSTFCPIMSFRQGSCVVTGSEDGSVYFLDVERTGNRSVVNTLQGHANTVLGISFNYNESLLATSDLQGLVIIWKKDNL